MSKVIIRGQTKYHRAKKASFLRLVVIGLMLSVVLGACTDPTPASTAGGGSIVNLAPTATAIVIPTATPSPSPTSTPTPTPTPSPTPTPTATPTPSPTPVPFEIATLRTANDTFGRLKSLHFTLEVRQGKIEVNGAELRRAEGDLQQPDRYQADVKVHVFVGDFTVKVVGLNKEQYMTDALSGRWSRSKPNEILNMAALLDPKAGVGPALLKMRSPRLIGNEVVNGVDTYHIQGQVAGPDIAPLTLNTLGKRDVTLDVWVGQSDGQLRQMHLKEIGNDPAFWVLTFSKFNDPIDIQKPNF